MKIGGPRGLRIVVYRSNIRSGPGLSPLEKGVKEGENPVLSLESAVYDMPSTSRAVWDCSPKWVVNFI